MVISTQAFPPNQRGQALGINDTTLAAGSGLGQRWLFFTHVPIGIAGGA